LAPLRFLQHPHEIAFLHDQVFDAVELDLGPRPFSEQHPVDDLHVDRDELAGLVASAGADGDDLALLRFFLGGIGDNDAARSLLLCYDALDNDAIVKRTELHGLAPCLDAVLLRADCGRGTLAREAAAFSTPSEGVPRAIWRGSVSLILQRSSTASNLA